MTQAHTRDFSRKRLPVFFTIDDVRYDCYKALDMGQLQQFARLASNLSSITEDLKDSDETAQTAESASHAIDRISGLMKIVMKKASFAVFIAKFKPTDDEREADDFEPIDHTQLTDIIRWLLEVYTGRPTQPSSSSSTGSETDDGGTSSMGGPLLEDLDQVDLSLETSSTS